MTPPHDGKGALQPSSSATLSGRRHHDSSHRLDTVTPVQKIVAHTPSSLASIEPKQSRVLFAVQNVIGALTCWVLLQLLSLQDALLAIGLVRWFVSCALMPRCRSVVDDMIVSPASNSSTFQNIQYYVSEESQKLLLHGSLYSLVGSSSQVSTTLPPVGRILLHTGARHTTGFQKAVASALASRLGASLLVVDETLLRAVSRATLGCDALDPSDGASGGVTGVLNTLLSFVLSGGRVACVWDVLTQVLTSAHAIQGALVVLVPDVESTLCGSFERWAAFQGAMAACTGHGSRPLVMLGGCSLLETAAASTGAGGLAPASLAGGCTVAAGEDDKVGPGHAKDSGSGYSPPQDESLSSLLPLAAELGLSLEERPDPRKVLSQIFPTRVQLLPPTDKAAAAQHMEQLQTDAASSGVTANHASLAALAAGCGIEVPPATAAIFTDHCLNSANWAKVLAWAVGLESARHQAKLLAQQAHRPQDGGSDAAASASQPTQRLQVLRRSISDSQLASSSSASGLPSPSLLHADPHEQPRKAELPSPGSTAGPAVSAPTAIDTSEAALPVTTYSKLSHEAIAQPTQVSQAALLYGIKMLRRSGGSIRGNVSIDNAYERRLIAEVIHPEAAGGGFKDVGALSAAKDALREAVQLPLQFPRLFSRGALARPCKGVLLFGPPGTGKTLLARAAAAECGAAFLAISPSTLASKWLGDGVRYVRALFTLAAKLSPCVIFIDEVDALLGKRNSHSEHEALREMKNELMAQWDGIRSATTGVAPRVMLLGATNRPGDLDDAVLRRFSRRLLCDLPDRAAREQILKVILDEEDLAADVSTSAIASATDGFSGSDLRQLCAAAAMIPVRQLLAASGKANALGILAGQSATVSLGSTPPATDSAQMSGAADHSADNDPLMQHRSQQQLQQLMVAEVVEEYEVTAAAAAAAEADPLRPLSAADFETAQRDVTPSVASDGSIMTELRAWDAQFGEGSKRRGWDSKLTYFT